MTIFSIMISYTADTLWPARRRGLKYRAGVTECLSAFLPCVLNTPQLPFHEESIYKCKLYNIFCFTVEMLTLEGNFIPPFPNQRFYNIHHLLVLACKSLRCHQTPCLPNTLPINNNLIGLLILIVKDVSLQVFTAAII
jgi:hypothetical protein